MCYGLLMEWNLNSNAIDAKPNWAHSAKFHLTKYLPSNAINETKIERIEHFPRNSRLQNSCYLRLLTPNNRTYVEK